MADPTRDEVQALIDKQEDSLQRIAMWILELPKERRKQAFDVAERTFEQSVGKFGMREEWGRSWIDLSMKRLRSLVINMGASGGHGPSLRSGGTSIARNQVPAFPDFERFKVKGNLVSGFGHLRK